MYRLVIIDDEYEHVQGIKNYIPWSKYDIEVCGIAYNGRDGLELIKTCCPDIAIIDIQMPFIDGLSLIEKVNDLNKSIEMIIISGHDDFEYARKAIQLKANNYLLKPCSAEEILQAVLRAKNIYIEETKKKEMLGQYQTIFEQYIILMKDRFLVDLLDNNLKNPTNFHNDLKSYRINMTNETCCAAIFRLEDKDKLFSQFTGEEIDCLILSITDKIKNAASESFRFETVIKNSDIVLITTHEPFNYCSFINFINDIYHTLSNTFDYEFAAGIGKTVLSPVNVNKSYVQALAALENSSFLGGKKVAVYYNEIFEENFFHLYPINEEKKLFQAIESGESSIIKTAVDDFFMAFDQYHANNSKIIKKIGISLLNSIMKFCSEKNIDIEELNQLIYNSFDEIANEKSFDALKEKINAIIEKLLFQIHDNAPTNKTIQLAINYIQNNFDKNISLKTVADELFISPSYLSFLFKQEVKVNFVEYLNNYRITIAKEVLKDVRLKSYEIAYHVGFQDEKYFFKLFKKYTGLTPSQYRESLSIFDIT
jgi:two-component system response regulator YesN